MSSDWLTVTVINGSVIVSASFRPNERSTLSLWGWNGKRESWRSDYDESKLPVPSSSNYDIGTANIKSFNYGVIECFLYQKVLKTSLYTEVLISHKNKKKMDENCRIMTFGKNEFFLSTLRFFVSETMICDFLPTPPTYATPTTFESFQISLDATCIFEESYEYLSLKCSDILD